MLSFCTCNDTYGLIIGTYNAPPFSMYEDKERIGLATEVMHDILAKAGINDYQVVDYPLARGIVELKNSRIDIFYPYISTLQDNTEQLILIGPISKYRVGLFVQSDNHNDISWHSVQDLILGTERGGVADKFLTQHKIKTEHTTEKLSCLRMAITQRVAACALGILPGLYESAINGIFSKIRYIETELYADMYLALGPRLSASELLAIKHAYAVLKKENYFEKKQQAYEKKFNIFIKSMT